MSFNLYDDEKILKGIENYVYSHFPELDLIKYKWHGDVYVWKLSLPFDIWEIIKYDSINQHIIQISNNFVVKDDSIELDEDSWDNCPTYDLYDCKDMKKLYDTIDRLHLQYKKWLTNIKLEKINNDFC
jgi:hypothetical protein